MSPIRSSRAKRALDLLLAGGGTLIFLPFGLLIAAVLRLTGEGEVFTASGDRARQARRSAYQFVTMLRTAQPGLGVDPLKTTRACSRSGASCARASFNEVPQLWNILRGEMSVVGPGR
jgi:lipopolysaccharide/colanic/teichoic acid biosynthesis glycosyltransferase